MRKHLADTQPYITTPSPTLVVLSLLRLKLNYPPILMSLSLLSLLLGRLYLSTKKRVTHPEGTSPHQTHGTWVMLKIDR